MKYQNNVCSTKGYMLKKIYENREQNKIDIILMSIFSFGLILKSLFCFKVGQYTGLFLTFCGIQAYVAASLLLFISLCAFSNEIHPWIKWLRAKDWPFFGLCVISMEFIVHFVFKFFN